MKVESYTKDESCCIISALSEVSGNLILNASKKRVVIV